MATFRREHEGKWYRIDAADEASAEEAWGKQLASMKGPSALEDVANTLPAAAVRAAASIPGGPAGIIDTVDKAWQYLTSKGLEWTGQLTPEQAQGIRKPIPGLEDGAFRGGIFPKPQLFTGAVEKATGQPLYEPQTMPGRAVDTAVQMAPNAMFPGTGAQRLAQVAVPATTSETAGELARVVSPKDEGAARMLGAVGGSVAASLAGRNTSANSIIQEAAPRLNDEIMDQASALIRQARDLPGGGFKLSWPEAIDYITSGGTKFGDVMRNVENSLRGGQITAPFFAPRGQQIQQSGNAAIQGLSDAPMLPDRTGLAVQRAAGQEIKDTQTALNAATRPLYEAAEAHSLTAEQAARLAADPLYAQTLGQIRANPALNATIRDLPDESVAVVDLVKRRMAEAAENARVPGEASSSNLIAGNYDAATAPARQAAIDATGGPTGPYARALQTQAELRQEVLEPLNAGPMGAMSRTDDVLAQGRALLPEKPAADYHKIVSQTVRRITRQNPDAAQNLVRTFIQNVFDDSMRRNMGTPGVANPWGGAKFASRLMGNQQQAANVEASIRALPKGNQRWEGFNNFIQTAEATGMRQSPGSPTAANQLIQETAKRAGPTGEVVSAVISGGTNIRSRLGRWFDEVTMGKNYEQLAEILTSPQSEALLRELARTAPGTPRAQALALRLTYITGASPERPIPESRERAR